MCHSLCVVVREQLWRFCSFLSTRGPQGVSLGHESLYLVLQAHYLHLLINFKSKFKFTSCFLILHIGEHILNTPSLCRPIIWKDVCWGFSGLQRAPLRPLAHSGAAVHCPWWTLNWSFGFTRAQHYWQNGCNYGDEMPYFNFPTGKMRCPSSSVPVLPSGVCGEPARHLSCGIRPWTDNDFPLHPGPLQMREDDWQHIQSMTSQMWGLGHTREACHSFILDGGMRL